ncbi:hypothetical protein K7432_014248 [Basidiobolus ranarum]|uniref:Sulfurtransferase n=1 Tax=Basidiobolus ranarum TaxID=34480 RepID=A0ABR2WI34_9FUNG
MLARSQLRNFAKLPGIFLPRVLTSTLHKSQLLERHTVLPSVSRVKLISTPQFAPSYSTWVDTGDVTYEELTKLIKDKSSKDVVLVDVRERSEVQTGKIPTSINLPLKELPKALQLDENDFVAAYGFPKISKDNNIVVYCHAGVRSAMAKQIIEQLGYTHVRNYPGSWREYSEKSQGKQ